MKQGSAVTYLFGDHLGSTSATTSDTGASIKRQLYYPYGMMRATDGVATDYSFTGQRRDDSTATALGTDGLLYYQARYYDPQLGRFSQPDSIIPDPYNPQSLNRYTYGLNNPVKYTDPTGHCPFCFVVALVMPRELYGAGARFVANLGLPVVSDFARLDVANADNFWNAANGDKFGLSTEQRIGAYGTGVVGSVIEGGAILYGAETVGSLATTAMTLAGSAGNASNGLDAFSRAADYGIQAFDDLRDRIRGTGLHAHHLVEQRFEPTIGTASGDWPSIALTPGEHQQFTNAWRDAIGYVTDHNPLNTATATLEDIRIAAETIYSDYPDLLNRARDIIDGY